MQECHYDEKMAKVMILAGLEFANVKCHYDEKMTKVMILVGLEFVSAGMSLWRKNDPGYDTSGIRVCKCKNVIMMKKWPSLWY